MDVLGLDGRPPDVHDLLGDVRDPPLDVRRACIELSALRGERPAPKDSGGAKVEKADDVAWPFDMNTREFREGVKKAEKDPTWGDDPAIVRAPEACS
ncbi:MAG: hypothetical protein OHK0013_27780 [Sandaracinaceae bacterium]